MTLKLCHLWWSSSCQKGLRDFSMLRWVLVSLRIFSQNNTVKVKFMTLLPRAKCDLIVCFDLNMVVDSVRD